MKQLPLLAEYPEVSGRPVLPLHSYHIKAIRVGEPLSTIKADQPEIAVDWWRRTLPQQDWFDPNKEHLVTLHLSTRYNIEGYSLISIGSLNETIAHPRDVFRASVVAGAYAMIVMHNHPSGDPSPSQTDHSLTRRLAEGAELLQIKLLDHLIVGRKDESRPGYFSFKEAGVI